MISKFGELFTVMFTVTCTLLLGSIIIAQTFVIASTCRYRVMTPLNWHGIYLPIATCRALTSR